MNSIEYIVLSALDAYGTPKTILVTREEYDDATPEDFFVPGSIDAATAKNEGTITISGDAAAINMLADTYRGE